MISAVLSASFRPLVLTSTEEIESSIPLSHSLSIIFLLRARAQGALSVYFRREVPLVA